MASYSRRSRSAGSHGSICGSMMVGASAAPPNMSFWPMRRGLVAALAGGENGLGAGEHARAVGIERVEGAGGGEAFDDALVDGARIDPRGEIRQRGEQPFLARLDDQLDRLRADALQRRPARNRWCCRRPRRWRRND